MELADIHSLSKTPLHGQDKRDHGNECNIPLIIMMRTQFWIKFTTYPDIERAVAD